MDRLTILEDGVRRLAGKGRGFHGHKGRPGKQGGSAPRSYQYAKTRDEWIEKAKTGAPPPDEVYRWVNLKEIHDMFLGKRTRTLDFTEDPDWYFAPPKIEKSDSFVVKTYGRLVLDGKKLADAGWQRDTGLFAEMAWRAFGDPRTRDDKHVIASFMGAIKKIEILNNPNKEDLGHLQAWLAYRLDRSIDVVKGENYNEEKRYV